MSTNATNAGVRSAFDRYFEISARGSHLSREIRGGFATFFTMAYIVVLNPLILGSGADAVGGKLPLAALAAGTALVAGVMTILMGVVARFPLALGRLGERGPIHRPGGYEPCVRVAFRGSSDSGRHLVSGGDPGMRGDRCAHRQHAPVTSDRLDVLRRRREPRLLFLRARVRGASAAVEEQCGRPRRALLFCDP